MAQQIDQIVEGLADGSLALEAACESLVAASRANPAGTRFWNQHIETAMTRGKLSRANARALLDALEGFQSDKTVWIDSGEMFPVQRPIGSAPASARTATPEPTIEADHPRDQEHRAAATPIESIDQLLNALIARTTKQPTGASVAALPATIPVEWFDPQTRNVDASAAHPANPTNVAPGTLIKDRYRIVSHLGAGGIGQVFEAIDTFSKNEERRVTLKVVAVNLRHEPHAFQTLREAVRKTQHLVHPNIVSVYEIDRHGDRVFIVMEALRGRWLSGLVREVRGKGLAHGTAWPIISGIASGLAFAHEQGIVHSDLSPHTVFLCEDGTAKIMGFGLVHAVPTSNESLDVLDTLTLRAYTEAYAADPWAQQSTPHAADDLYPLGVIAYEMLTGTHPFQRYSLAVARQKHLEFVPIGGLNRRARKLLERCLSFERKTRPQDGAGFLRKMQPGVLDSLLPASAF
jgi:hypothetical protein